MDIYIDVAGFVLSKQLNKYLDGLITAKSTGKNSVIINFRDKSYSATKDGYHLVEISIAADGKIHYITDFAYYGMSDYAHIN